MSIVQSIKDHLLVARKNGGNDVPMISTILSEIEIVGKNNGNSFNY